MICFRIVLFLFFCLAQNACQSQSRSQNLCQDPEFDKMVARTISFKTPVLSVEDLKGDYQQYMILDAREPEEYRLSHLPGARFIGYNNPDFTIVQHTDPDQPILVYCSIGYRSDKIGDRLRKMGFRNVYNLYGSIFEWANRGYPLTDSSGKPVNTIHGYNKKWSKWISNDTLSVSW